MTRRILVTGASGLVGRYAVAALRDAGWTVLTTARRHPYDAATLLLDLTDREALAALPSDIDGIVHMAASVPATITDADPDEMIAANAEATLNLLDFAAAAGVRSFVLGSTAAMYGSQQGPDLTTEDHDLDLSDFYCLSKRAAELLTRPFAFVHHVDIKILRFAYVYGTGMRESTVLHRFIRLAQQGRPIPLANGGTDRFNFVHARDCATAIVQAVSNGSGIYNIGASRSASIRELAEAVLNAVPAASDLEFMESAAGPRQVLLDTSRAQRDLGWTAQYDISAGISAYVSEMARA